MGTGEGGTPTNAAKPSSTPQEQPATTPAYPDWAAAFQAYYGPGVTPPPPPYFASAVGSGPTPHPYMWGGQPLMPPYATTPYAAMYPHGGIYGHPSMPLGAHSYGQYGVPSASNATEVTTAATPSSTETEAKSSGGKNRSSTKRVKGSLGKLEIITSKGEGGKATSCSANGAFSQSGDSGGEGSSEGDNSQNGSQRGRKGSIKQPMVNGTAVHNTNISPYNVQAGEANVSAGRNTMATVLPVSVTGNPAVSVSTTNLNVGMDFWNTSTPGALSSVKGRRATTSIASAIVPTTAQLMPSRDGVPSELWVQDERELKRQRRKQSNRESARRSRLRKQAECEELTTKVDALTAENMALRTELNRLAEESKKLTSENAALLEQLRNSHREVAVPDSEKHGSSKIDSHFVQPGGNEHFHVISKVSNSNSGQKNEQRESETRDSAGMAQTLLEANARSDTVAAG